jgi:hypothetical protein
MSYDFVICDKAATVIAAIELDDKSHESECRIESDAKKEQSHSRCRASTCPLARQVPADELTIQRELIANDASLSGALPSIYVERRE